MLFSSFPQSASADVDLQLRSYLDTVKDHDVRDVLFAIDRFRRGEVPDTNTAFCPSSAQLVSQVRFCRSFRLGQERRNLSLVKG